MLIPDSKKRRLTHLFETFVVAWEIKQKMGHLMYQAIDSSRV